MKKRIISIIKAIFLFISIALLFYLIVHNLNEIKQYHFKVNVLYLGTSFIILLISSIMLPFIWHLLTKILGCNLPLRESLQVRLISEVGKYIPGRVFGYGYLLLHYKEKEQNSTRVLSSSIYELYLSTFSAFLFFTIIQSFISFEQLTQYKLVFYLGSILGIIALHPLLFQKISDLYCKITKQERLSYTIAYNRILQMLLFYLGYWTIFSVAFYFFVKAFTDIQLTSIIYLSGCFSISAFAGFLAFFMPAGIGAREGALIYLLGSLAGNIIAGIISIGSRIWIIGADLILLTIALVSKSIR